MQNTTDGSYKATASTYVIHTSSTVQLTSKLTLARDNTCVFFYFCRVAQSKQVCDTRVNFYVEHARYISRGVMHYMRLFINLDVSGTVCTCLCVYCIDSLCTYMVMTDLHNIFITTALICDRPSDKLTQNTSNHKKLIILGSIYDIYFQ